MLLTTRPSGAGRGGGVDIHSMIIFFELHNIVHGNDFINKKI
jgi:hypothetical protein